MSDRKTKPRTKATQKKRAPKKPALPAPTGSYFLSLELENVRCFSERQTLDLSDGHGRPARWTILLGENGTGKTTILQALAAMEPVEVRPKGEDLFGPIRRCQRLDGPLFMRGGDPAELVVRYAGGTRLEANASIQEGSLKYQERNTVISAFHINGNVDFPQCAGYGAGRRFGKISLERSASNDATLSLFFDTADLINAENWLLQLDYSVSKLPKNQNRQSCNLLMVTNVLISLLPGIEGIRFDASSGFFPTPHVQFKTPYGWVPLRHLGYGYKTMIAWVVDLAARMIERYPESPDPLAEPAVVLVDEIDLHLHPKWQRNVVGYLTERFPNTQFIVTSHSPLIVQSAADANLALLRREGDHVVIENHPETIRGWRIDQVLTSDLFGLPTARPPGEEKLMLRRDQLLAKSRLTAVDRRKLEEINEQIGPVPSGESFDDARKTMDLIEKSLKLIEKYQGTTP